MENADRENFISLSHSARIWDLPKEGSFCAWHFCNVPGCPICSIKKELSTQHRAVFDLPVSPEWFSPVMTAWFLKPILRRFVFPQICTFLCSAGLVEAPSHISPEMSSWLMMPLISPIVVQSSQWRPGLCLRRCVDTVIVWYINQPINKKQPHVDPLFIFSCSFVGCPDLLPEVRTGRKCHHHPSLFLLPFQSLAAAAVILVLLPCLLPCVPLALRKDEPFGYLAGNEQKA